MAINFPTTALDGETHEDENGVIWVCQNSSITNPGTSFRWARSGVAGSSSGGGGGGTPDWEYLLLDQDVQLVDGDAKAVEVADKIPSDTGLYSAPTSAGYSLNGKVMTIAAGTTVSDVCVHIDADNNPVEATGDFVFEVQAAGVCKANRGLQVGFTPNWTSAANSVASLWFYDTTRLKFDGSSISYGSGPNGTGVGVLKIEAMDTALNFYADDSLIATGTRPAGGLYLKLWGYWSHSSWPFDVTTTVTAIRADVYPSPPRILLPASPVGSTSSVNVRDFTGDASAWPSPIPVEASAGGTIFGQSKYDITTPKGSFNFISPLGTEDWVADNNSTWGDTTAARGTLLRDKLQEPSTGTTDLAKKDA